MGRYERVCRKESHAHEPKTLCELHLWDTAAIEERSKKIAQWVVKHWPNLTSLKETLSTITKKLRTLEDHVAPRISALGLEHALFNFTKTGSNKTTPATKTVSDFLQDADIHEFARQELGPTPSDRSLFDILPSGLEAPVDMTLYRTKSKKEPRLWIKGLDSYAGQWSLIALCLVDGELVAVNCSHSPTLDAFCSLNG